jgi:hypothetical protein
MDFQSDVHHTSLRKATKDNSNKKSKTSKEMIIYRNSANNQGI